MRIGSRSAVMAAVMAAVTAARKNRRDGDDAEEASSAASSLSKRDRGRVSSGPQRDLHRSSQRARFARQAHKICESWFKVAECTCFLRRCYVVDVQLKAAGHVHILSVRGKLRVRVGGDIRGESVARWTASEMGSRANWSARSASAINESRQNGAERRRRRLAEGSAHPSSFKLTLNYKLAPNYKLPPPAHHSRFI